MAGVISIDDALRRKLSREAGIDPTSIEQRETAAMRVRERDRKKEVISIIRLKLAGCTTNEIAQTLYTEQYETNKLSAVHKVAVRLAEGRKKKWILNDDQDRIDHLMIPATIDGINDLILSGDKDTLLEAAKGVGIFKSHQTIKSQSVQMTELRVKIDMEGAPVPRAMEIGSLPTPLAITDCGTPDLETVEGEVVKSL